MDGQYLARTSENELRNEQHSPHLTNVQIRIFVSHATADREMAEAFVELLKAAMPLLPREIRCTSVDGYTLPTGTLVDHQLREELLNATVFIALLTPASLESHYVLFELGARWGSQRPLFPLLANGVTPFELKGPIRAVAARVANSAPEVHRILQDVAVALGVAAHSPDAYHKHLNGFLKAAAAPNNPLPQRGRPMESARPEGLQVARRYKTVETGRDICLVLRGIPPFQVKSTAQSYVGVNVDWEVEYSSADLEKENRVKVTVHPFEPEGFDVCIRLETTLGKNPELVHLPKGTLGKVEGVIVRLDQYSICLSDAKFRPLSDSERSGTRSRFLVPPIRALLPFATRSSIEDRTILECVKALFDLGEFPRHRLSADEVIRPEIEPGSVGFKLVTLKAAKNLVLNSCDIPDKQRGEVLFKFDTDIYDAENYS